jgi:hypothetical protein
VTYYVAIFLSAWFLAFVLLMLFLLARGGLRKALLSVFGTLLAFIVSSAAITLISALSTNMPYGDLFAFIRLSGGILVEDAMVILIIVRFAKSASDVEKYAFTLAAGYSLIETILQFGGLVPSMYFILSGYLVYTVAGTEVTFLTALVITLICMLRLIGHYLLNSVMLFFWNNSYRKSLVVLIGLHVSMDYALSLVSGTVSKTLLVSLILMSLAVGSLYGVFRRANNGAAPGNSYIPG